MTNTNFETVKAEVTAEHAADVKRAEVLRFEIAAFERYQARQPQHMRFIHARGLAERRNELETLETLIELRERNGLDDCARCELAARME
jgi:hypothetical protein